MRPPARTAGARRGGWRTRTAQRHLHLQTARFEQRRVALGSHRQLRRHMCPMVLARRARACTGSQDGHRMCSAFFTGNPRSRGILWAMNERQPRRHACALDGVGAVEAGDPAVPAACPNVPRAPEEVYELAKRRGMDFVTITDHDTIDGRPGDRPSARRVHLRGADRVVQRRAPGGPRPLLRDHPRGPRVAAGPQRQRRDCAAYLQEHGDHRRARASLLRRRGAAHRAPPSPPGPALPDLGDPQRVPRQGAQPAGVRVHRDPWRHRHRRLR